MRVIIYGPPGTGKTTALIARGDIAFQAARSGETDNNRIAFLSFTRAAARVMRDRLRASGENTRGITFSTLHSFCFRRLKLKKEQMIMQSDLKSIEQATKVEIINKFDDYVLSEGQEYLRIADYFLSLKKKKISAVDFANKLSPEVKGSYKRFTYFIKSYYNYKKANNVVDFTDMILQAQRISDPQLDYLFIDEAQDLSYLQWSLIKQWSSAISNIICAGDDDQAIYEFAGANPQGLSTWEKEQQAERVILDFSFRLGRKPHALSNRVISKIRNRVKKDYRANSKQKTEIKQFGKIERALMSARSDPDFVSSAAVLYRNVSQRDDLRDTLLRQVLPYDEQKKQSPFAHRIFRGAVLFRRYCSGEDLNERDKSLLLRETKESYRAAIRQGEEINEPWHKVINNCHRDFFNYLLRMERRGIYDIFKTPRILLSTIHGVKGMEFDHVFLINGMGDRTMQKTSNERTKDAETRVWYVALTRAKKNLYIINGNNPFPYLK